ncbi:MAG: DEAD/DEAH box helicase [bacterium]|nr:DEAD/DEAH box helicase [bacterium]
MSNEFKQKLARLYIDQSGRFGRSDHREDEYKRMIRYGAMGDLGENYYLYIYRDIYRNAAYYGAVIFLNKPDETGNPVRVQCIEQDGIEQTRNIYIRAALYFLRNDCQNTMDISGKIKLVFHMAREKINAYIDLGSSPIKELENFNFDVKNQEVSFKELEPKTITRQLENRNLKRQLLKLKEKQVKEIIAINKTLAAPGLHLKIDFANLTGEKNLHFYPIALPYKNDGRCGSPKKLTPADVKLYQLENLSPTLKSLLEHYSTLESPDFSDAQRIKTINRLYFHRLVEELFTLPKESVFCQSPDLPKAFNPLKAVRFKKALVRFTPCLKKDTLFRIRLKLTVRQDGNDILLDAGSNFTFKQKDEKIYLFFTTPGEGNYFAIPTKEKHFYKFFKFLAEGNEFFICDFHDVLKALQKVESKHLEIDSGLLKRYTLSLKPAPVLKICSKNEAEQKQERLILDFDYHSEIKKFLKTSPDKEVFTYERDSDFETMCNHLMKTDPLLKQEMDYNERDKSVDYFYNFKERDFIYWIVERGGYYMDKGFRIYVEEWNRFIGNTGSKIKVGLTNNIDWLEFTPRIHISDTDAGFAIEEIDLEKSMVTDKKGQLHLLSKEELEKLKEIYLYGEQHGDTFRIPSRNHILVNALYDERMQEMPELENILTNSKKLEEFEKIDNYPVSANFRGQLRPYQQEGFKWLYFLREYGFPGCLADDMGLGKTVQTLALLQTLKDQNKLKTSLLVAPVSAIPNWEGEIEKFTSGLSFHRHIGSKRDKESTGWHEKELIITSYATMRNDIELLSQFQFDYIILDESQNIKNHTSQVSRAAKVLKGNSRLALSGTPIENNTMELWSLFDFLITGYLGNYRWFAHQFSNAIERDKSSSRIALLKKMIFPFILRRRKEEVELELPEKTEIVSKLRMEEEQATLYSEIAKSYRESIENEIEEKGVAKSSMKILEGMLRLRQVCLFPWLVDEKYSDVPSAKFAHFTGLLEDILAENHKVLVFSQFVEALKIIRGHFDESGIEYSYIDGSVNIKERGKNIKAFQEEEQRQVFLLSLKAGGVAINLTAADYVIIFDPWWNPAVEAQAIDRSHRIGQTRKVLVYRMVVEGSIEEKMLQLQESKRELVENLIVSDTKTFKNLKKEDILKLF